MMRHNPTFIFFYSLYFLSISAFPSNGFAQIDNCETLIVTIEKQEVADCLEESGSATVIVEGGTPPYNFLWSNGDTENFADSLEVGIFSVVITDSENCEYQANVVIQKLPSIEIDLSSTTSLCGTETGTATAVATGGTPPYQYNWSNGQTDATSIEMGEGIYSITVTDAQDCSMVESLTIIGEELEVPILEDACVNDAFLTLPNIHPNGIWVGVGVYLEEETYILRPNEVGVGTHTIDYVAPWCEHLSVDVFIMDIPNPSFVFPNETGFHCIGDGDIVFAILGQEPGAFSINGEMIEGNVWTPNEVGTYTVTYEVFSSNENCVASESKELKVIETFNPTWTTSNGFSVCESDLPLELEVEMSGGTWTADINSEIYLEDGKVFFDAEIENKDHGAFSITYEGGGQNCGQANTHVINVYNIPKAPEVVYPLEVACASEPTVIQMEGDPTFCNCPVRFNVYAEDGEQIYAGDTFNDDVLDVSPFLEEGTNTFEVVTLNKICESSPVEVTIQVEAAIDVSFDITEPDCQNMGSITAMASGGAEGYFYSWSNGNIGAENEDLEGGSYVVFVTDAGDCTTAAQVDLPFAPTPMVDLGADQVVEVGETVILDAGSEGVTYSWSNGETGSMITVLESGTYTVTVTNQEGCSTTDEVTIDFASDITAIATLEEWQLFPNPTQNQVFIELKFIENTDLKLEIRDLIGRLVLSETHAFQKGKYHLQFSTSNWASGLYWVVLEGENRTNVQKLLKE